MSDPPASRVGGSMSAESRDRVIVEVRLNEFAMRDENAHVLYSPEEIAKQALQCRDAGASIVHYHARVPQTGAVSNNPKLYVATNRRIHAESDLITMPTLGMSSTSSAKERVAHVAEMAKHPDTRADLAPIDMTTANLDRFDRAARRFRTVDQVYVNTTKMWQELAVALTSLGVRPVPVLWHVGSIRATEALVAMGLFTPPVWCEIVLTEGELLVGHPGTIKGLEAFLDFWPSDSRWPWSVMSCGGSLLSLATAAMERGGHISIGLGDYHYRELGLPTNAELVERVVQIARAVGRQVATPAEARTIVGLT